MSPTRLARTFPLATFALGALLAVSPAGAVTHLPADFVDEPVIQFMRFPVGMAFLPDGRLLFVEQRTARLRVIVAGHIATVDPAGTVPTVRATFSEQGLLGVAVDPQWPARPYVYFHMTDGAFARIRISRFTLSGDLDGSGDGSLVMDPDSRFDVFVDGPDNASTHNGGTVRFGPDGMLYASLGDDQGFCDSVTFRGVILRFDVSALPDGPGAATLEQVTPADNPFVTHPNPSARLVYALGLRNPFRFHIEPTTGHLFIADVGYNTREEISDVKGPGEDMGWPMQEGTVPLMACTGAPGGGLTSPIYDYSTGFQGAVISGGVYHAVPTSRAFPAEYEGDYFFSDFYQGFLRRLKWTGTEWKVADPVPGQPDAVSWGTGFTQVADYTVGPDGELWYCQRANASGSDNTGQIRRIGYVPGVGVAPHGADVLRFAAGPTPSAGAITLEYTLGRETRTRLDLYDLGGRHVRTVHAPAPRAPGRHAVAWDGRDDDGRTVEAGVYFARLEAGADVLTRRICRLR